MKRGFDDLLLVELAKHYADEGRSVYVKLRDGQQLRIDATGVPFGEPASDKQLAFIRSLCDEKQQPEPDGPLTKVQASEIISDLQKGTYDPAKWTVPF